MNYPTWGKNLESINVVIIIAVTPHKIVFDNNFFKPTKFNSPIIIERAVSTKTIRTLRYMFITINSIKLQFYNSFAFLRPQCQP